MRIIKVKPLYSEIQLLHHQIKGFLDDHLVTIELICKRQRKDGFANLIREEQNLLLEFEVITDRFLNRINLLQRELEVIQLNGGRNEEWFKISEEHWLWRNELLKRKWYTLRTRSIIDEMFGYRLPQEIPIHETVILEPS